MYDTDGVEQPILHSEFALCQLAFLSKCTVASPLFPHDRSYSWYAQALNRVQGFGLPEKAQGTPARRNRPSASARPLVLTTEEQPPALGGIEEVRRQVPEAFAQATGHRANLDTTLYGGYRLSPPMLVRGGVPTEGGERHDQSGLGASP